MSPDDLVAQEHSGIAFAFFAGCLQLVPFILLLFSHSLLSVFSNTRSIGDSEGPGLHFQGLVYYVVAPVLFGGPHFGPWQALAASTFCLS